MINLTTNAIGHVLIYLIVITLALSIGIMLYTDYKTKRKSDGRLD